MRIAVVGSGVAGLGAAHQLAPEHQVSLFEAQARAGGHAHSVDVRLDGMEWPVDTGFLVLNERTYPRLLALFNELGIATAISDMSFSVSLGPHRHEWCGSDLRGLFAQARNALSPRFWGMLADIARFNKQASALAARDDEASETLRRMPLERFLSIHRYGDAFRDHYLLPMAAAIWSCPMARMKAFPIGSFVRFFHNHGLLQISNRPQWFTVPGGSRRYVDAILSRLDDVRLSCPVRMVSREHWQSQRKLSVRTDSGTELFDAVIMASHSTQSLGLLEQPEADEHRILSAIPYQPNTAWLHTDTMLMPKRRRAWAAWNYLSNGVSDAPAVSVSYWLNRLQPLPFATPLFVSLNPLSPPDPASVIGRFDYEHPIFDNKSSTAQQDLASIQGRSGIWFAGAWTGYGFHEDGLRSGQQAAAAICATQALARAA